MNIWPSSSGTLFKVLIFWKMSLCLHFHSSSSILPDAWKQLCVFYSNFTFPLLYGMSTEACRYHAVLATNCPVHVVLFSVLTIKCIKTIKSWLNIWHCRAGICSRHSTSSKHFRVGWLWFYYIIINVETVTSHKYIVKIAEVCLGPSRKTIGKVIKYFLWNSNSNFWNQTF